MEIGLYPVLFFIIVVVGFLLFSVMVMKRIIRERNKLESTNMELQAEKKELRIAIQMNEQQKVALRTRLMRDATDMLRKEQKIDKLLDKMEKRESVREKFKEDIVALRKERTSRLYVLILKVDTLPEIKKAYGPRFSGEVLKKVHQRIEDMLRGSDEAVMMDEEFSILISAAFPEECEVVAERIRKAIETADFSYEGEEVDVPVSIYFAEDHDEAIDQRHRA